MAHENQHERDWQLVWPNGYDSDKDLDGDYLDDEWEIANCDIMKLHCANPPGSPKEQWQEYANWSQQRALSVENGYPDKSLSSDWASPGTNY